MSQENVETVRRLSEAFNKGEEAWLTFYSPDAELHLPSGRRNDPADVYKGSDGMQRAAAKISEAFDDTRWDREMLIDAGDRVVGLFYRRGRSKIDGTSVRFEVAGVFTVLDGKVVHVRRYPSWRTALDSVKSAE